MKKKIDKVQKAISKYEIQFHAFMINLNDAVKKDKAFKDIEGNMFTGLCIAMRKDINGFLRYARKK